MRVVFLGMPGRLAAPALQTLLAAEVRLVAVAVPAPPGAPPLAPAPAALPPRGAISLGPPAPPGLLALAAAHGLPAFALRRMDDPAVHEAIRALAPDLVCVACWPWRIPPALLALPRLGWLNLHPSPLPELRGPQPLFWALQQGREQSAVTLHWMDVGLDTGPVAMAAPFALPVGIGWNQAEDRAAAVGAELLRALLPRLAAGERPSTPQPSGGSYFPSPGPAAFALDTAWPARRAFQFMRGTAAWGELYTLRVAGRTLRLAAALDYQPGAQLDAPLQIDGGLAALQLTPGVLRATLAG